MKSNKLEAVRETMNLSYSSYILALAMGSGKTVLIGTIIAIEFALALEYRNDEFIKNALVFAPGKTILGALKEISNIPFEKILPPRLYKQFMASVKITYTQDGQKDIPILMGSSFNIVVTNTEKIRIQKPTKKKSPISFFDTKTLEKENEKEEVANKRLKTIASLPNLGIFSDEAHHTYGRSMDKELKKVRKTVDYLANETNVIAVVNTTGTPYYKKQMLKDVIYWYGLSQGIEEGILKEVRKSVRSYDDVNTEEFVKLVLDNFISEYRDVSLPNGAFSKIAIYFPNVDDVANIKPFVEKKMLELKLDPSTVFDVNNKSDDKKKDYFNNRVNEIHNPYRVYLLVNMGTEGWNCPSLFATGLARKLKTSNNFVLQASSRCLRQVPGNHSNARIYLSKENVAILDKQLKETYGESLSDLDYTKQDMIKDRIIIRKYDMPPILIKRKIKRVVPDEMNTADIQLSLPDVSEIKTKQIDYRMRESMNSKHVLSENGIKEIELSEDSIGLYEASHELAEIYRLSGLRLNEKLRQLYEDEIPLSHIDALKVQIESQKKNYRITEEEVEQALALIKKEGFDRKEQDGKTVYSAEIMYHKDKADLILRHADYQKENPHDFSFHYSPYNLDSHPEKDFFLRLLERINEDPRDIEDIYFTGGLSSRSRTDFLFEYKDGNGKWHDYSPDFLIRKKDGKSLIVEIKAETFRDERKEMVIRELEKINPDSLRYEILMTKTDEIGFENRNKIEEWLDE